MTRVEELRRQLRDKIRQFALGELMGDRDWTVIDDLIAAAKEEERDRMRIEAKVDTREPEVGDWVCYKYAEGTAISVVQYIVDKKSGAMPETTTKREYVTFMRTLERDDILEVRRRGW